MMMFYRRRASPKLRDDMTEVEYGGGGHRTRLRNDHEDQLVSLGVPPAPVYKGARGKAGRPLGHAKDGGVLLLVGVGLPFPSSTRKEEGGRKERERERERGAAPPSPSPIRTPLGRGAPPPGLLPSLSPQAH